MNRGQILAKELLPHRCSTSLCAYIRKSGSLFEPHTRDNSSRDTLILNRPLIYAQKQFHHRSDRICWRMLLPCVSRSSPPVLILSGDFAEPISNHPSQNIEAALLGTWRPKLDTDEDYTWKITKLDSTHYSISDDALDAIMWHTKVGKD